ncbi:MAG TPA: helix-turn-helix domain-containing protein [Treponemataceae bacterium]|nr:helix-turn-helix domain-containing protein [Treponemataceae bacterium]
MKRETRIDWEERVGRSLRMMSESLDRGDGLELALERAAAEAASSPWHFHRAFRSLTGETFAFCLRRLTLERAAFRLKDGASVIDAALEAGFESAEAFSRAFSRAFGIAPSKIASLPWWKGELPSPNGLHWRPERMSRWHYRPEAEGGASPTGGTSPTGAGLALAARIVSLPPMKAAAITGSGDPWALPSLWEELTQSLERAGRRPEPGSFLSFFAEKDFGAALALDDAEAVPEGLEGISLPGGLYAIATFTGPCEAIGPAWDALDREFFPSSGLARDPTRPRLEWYQNAAPAGLAELTVTFLCDPVVP